MIYNLDLIIYETTRQKTSHSSYWENIWAIGRALSLFDLDQFSFNTLQRISSFSLQKVRQMAIYGAIGD